MGKGDQQPQYQTQTQTVSMTPQQQAIFDMIFPMLQGYAGGPNPYTTLGGQDPTDLVAGFNKKQLVSQKMGSQAARHQNRMAKAGWRGLKPIISGKLMNPDANPWLQDYMDAAIRPITQNFREQVLPGISTGALDAGQFGSSRHGVAEGLASRGYTDSVASATAGIGSAAYGQGLNAYMQGLGMVPTMQNARTAGTRTMAAVGDVKQAQDQKMLDAAQQLQYWNLFAPMLQGRDILSLIQGIPGSQSTTTGVTTGGGVEQDPFSQILGGGLSLLSLFL